MLSVFVGDFFPGDFGTADGVADGVAADGDAAAAGVLARGELVAATGVPAALEVHDGSVAATTLPVPSTMIPPASAAAISLGLILKFLTIGFVYWCALSGGFGATA